jgi:hypothetical protein
LNHIYGCDSFIWGPDDKGNYVAGWEIHVAEFLGPTAKDKLGLKTTTLTDDYRESNVRFSALS